MCLLQKGVRLKEERFRGWNWESIVRLWKPEIPKNQLSDQMNSLQLLNIWIWSWELKTSPFRKGIYRENGIKLRTESWSTWFLEVSWRPRRAWRSKRKAAIVTPRSQKERVTQKGNGYCAECYWELGRMKMRKYLGSWWPWQEQINEEVGAEVRECRWPKQFFEDILIFTKIRWNGWN